VKYPAEKKLRARRGGCTGQSQIKKKGGEFDEVMVFPGGAFEFDAEGVFALVFARGAERKRARNGEIVGGVVDAGAGWPGMNALWGITVMVWTALC